MIDQSTLKSIEDLHRLKGEGVITEEEFERSKEELLFGRKPAQASAAGARAPIQPFGPPPAALPAENDVIGWIILPLKRYADFSGRSARREFWLFQLLPAAIILILLIAATPSNSPFDSTTDGEEAVAAICALALLGLLVPMLALQVRRLHDQDRSGWLVLVNLIPYLGSIVLFIFYMLPGTSGENRYGPDPLAG